MLLHIPAVLTPVQLAEMRAALVSADWIDGRDVEIDDFTALGALRGNSWRDIRVEADTKTPGFTAPPAVSVEFDPVQLVFVASGDAPFTLAAGLPATDAQAAASAYLPLQSLVPGYQPAQENTLPLARTEVAAAGAANIPASVQAPDLSNKTSTKTMVLWGVLLAGVLALGLMAWALARRRVRSQRTAWRRR